MADDYSILRAVHSVPRYLSVSFLTNSVGQIIYTLGTLVCIISYPLSLKPPNLLSLLRRGWVWWQWWLLDPYPLPRLYPTAGGEGPSRQVSPI